MNRNETGQAGTNAYAQSGHTPGPWVATSWFGDVCGHKSGSSHSGEHAAVFALDDEGNLSTMIAPLGLVDDGESVANALLIAAAPELAAENERLRAANRALVEAAGPFVALLRNTQLLKVSPGPLADEIVLPIGVADLRALARAVEASDD